jgi:D-beta-D-heptose 7-phosphate kinase/D-beta-D-heptose 1-phosphate adenosyltransferase
VLVVGDVILDRYLCGSVSRISPEAPVPVVSWESEDARLGGAANVVANLVALGARPELVSVTGDDESGAVLRELLRDRQVGDDGVIASSGRRTPVKTRILARHQQVLRLDREDTSPVDDDLAGSVVFAALERLQRSEALVVSDYAKGLLDGRTLGRLLGAARERGVPVVVDPKLRNFSLYQPATLITPNEAEAASATAMEVRSPEDLLRSARAILDRLDVRAALITRGDAGMLLVARGESEVFIPGVAREVFDVTGAGDTVVATLAVALASGMSLETSARWANLAGALSVGHLGTATVTAEELESFARDCG